MAIKRGIDISRWQGADFDIQNCKNNGIEFVIVKAGGSDDGRYTDSCFENFYQKSIDCNMPVGAYYFGRDFSLEEAEVSANHFLSIVNGKNFNYPLYYDVEADMLNQDSRTLTDIIIRFCTIVKNAGYTVGVYSSKSPLNSQIYMNELIDSGFIEIWVACYYSYNENDNNVNPNDYADTQYGMWQYSSFGQIDGHNGRVDMNYCYRDYISNQITSDSDIEIMINNAYNNILGRGADLEGMENYKNAIKNGMTEQDLINALSTSMEYYTRIITIAYNEILHRDPDAEGLQVWCNALSDGMSIETIRDTISNSPEALGNRERELEKKRILVKNLYHDYLTHEASEDEVNSWIELSEEDITNSIINSPEAQTRKENDAKIAEEQAKAEANRIAEQEKLAENERIKANAENELQTSLSTTDTSYYTAIKDESTGLYNLVSNFGNDDSDISAEQEINRIAQKDAYERYNNIISSLYRITL